MKETVCLFYWERDKPLSGRTLLLEKEGNVDIARVVIENSRMVFAKKVEPIEVKLQEETKLEEGKKAKPKSRKKSEDKKDPPKQDASGGMLDNV